MKNAVIYARYSSDAQRDSSIDDQVRNCRRRADVDGWTVARVYADRAISGSSANRPDYQAMLAAASRGEFDVLIIDDLSRLSRDSIEQERAIRKLEFQQIRIVSASDGYDSQSHARKVHRGFKGLMNEIFLDDLRDKVHRGLEGQAKREFWCGGRPYGYRLRPVLDKCRLDPYGHPLKVGTKLEIDPHQAEVVRQMFAWYVAGRSCLSIARELNANREPSQGSTWNRKIHRSAGWAASAVRVIVRNELYTGLVRWNKSKFVRDPETQSMKRLKRPESEVVEFRDEGIRVVSDSMFRASLDRTLIRANTDVRLKSGSKAKFLLSGLLKCPCGAHFVMGDARAYVCGGRREGACASKVRVRRDVAENLILGPVREQLLSPERVARMAKEMHDAYLSKVRSSQERAVNAPRELQELDQRIGRLRARMAAGDPDLTADELQVAIERAESKRRELLASGAEAKQGAKLLALLPTAAAAFRQQIDDGLDGDERASQRARVALRKLLGVVLIEADGQGNVWAAYELQPAALLQAAGTGGRGDRI